MPLLMRRRLASRQLTQLMEIQVSRNAELRPKLTEAQNLQTPLLTSAPQLCPQIVAAVAERASSEPLIYQPRRVTSKLKRDRTAVFDDGGRLRGGTRPVIAGRIGCPARP